MKKVERHIWDRMLAKDYHLRKGKGHMDYGRALRTARVARKLSQKELAKLAEVDPSYISFIEKGTRTPSTSTLQKLADVLHIPLYLLMLLGSEADDLNGISEEECDRLGGRLLRVLIPFDRLRKMR